MGLGDVYKRQDCDRPMLCIDDRHDGAISASGQVMGSYLHGLFADDRFRRAFLDDLAQQRGRSGAFGRIDFDARIESVLDDLARHMATNLDMDALADIAGC